MSKKTPTIIITGANGFLGSTLTAYFAAQKWQVIALVRSPEKYTSTSAIRYAAYDLASPVDESYFKDADYLVHTAFAKQDRTQPNAFQLNLDAAASLLAASRKHRLQKNIFISSMSAHEAAESVYGRQKLATEKLFNTKQDCSLSCGLMIGNGGIVKQMTDFMRSKHAVPLIGGGKQPLQSIGVYDLARVIHQVITRDLSGVLTVANPTVFTYKQFYAAIARTIGIKVLYVPVPFRMLLSTLSVIEALHLPLSIGKENLLGLKKLRAVDNAADMKQIGITVDGLEEALQKTIGTGRTSE